MTATLFWNLIARLGHDLQPNRLGTALAALPASEFLGFGWQLRQAAGELDGVAHRYFAAGAKEHQLPLRSKGGRPCSTGCEAPDLQELQLTVVALGRDVWSAVVAMPVLLEASWPVELGRQLDRLSVRQHGSCTALKGA